MAEKRRLNYPADAASLRDEIRDLTACIRDNGTSTYGAGGKGQADLWITVQGVDYVITIQKWNARIAWKAR